MVRAASSLPVAVVLRAAVEAALLRVGVARLPAEGVVRQVELAAPVVREGPAAPEAVEGPGDLVVL